MKVGFLLQDRAEVFGAGRVTMELVAGLRARGAVDAKCLLIEETRLARTEGALCRAMEEEDIPHVVLPVERALSWGLVKAIRRHVIEQDVAVLNATGPKAVVHGYLALRDSSVPLVCTVHGWLCRPDPKERFHEWLELQVLKRSARVVALSRYYEQLLLSKGVSRNRLLRIPTGIAAASREGILTSESRGDSPFTVGMLGRFSSEKNHGMLLEVARLLKERGVDYRFLIAGEGPERNKIEARTEELGLGDAIKLLGYTEPQTFMQQIDVLALCSVIENLPYCVLEAMSCRLPVVATNVGGLPDLVENGVTGFLVPPHDAETMADRLQCLVEDPEERFSMGDRGYEKVRREFSLEKNLKAHEDMYEAIVKG